MKKSKYTVEGMTCVNCAQGLEKSLKKNDSIDKVEINFTTKTGFFETDLSFEELKSEIENLGYQLTRETSLEETFSLKPFFISLVFSVLIFLLHIKGHHFFYERISWGIQCLFSSIILWFAGRPFLKAIWIFIRQRHSGMNTLIGVGTFSAYIYSFLVLILYPKLGNQVYFEAIGFIITFVHLGKYLEEKAKKKAKESLDTLFRLQSQTAIIVDDEGNEKEVPINEVIKGDKVRVKPGQKVPVDGVIIEGESSIDESTMTGESLPILKTIKGPVFAGTLNIDGSFIFKAQKVGSETFLSQIIQYVENAQNQKPSIQRYADKISSIFVPIVLALSFLTFLFWIISGSDLGTAISYMVAVLVVACPCALGLATPTAVVVSTGMAAQKGLLISGGEAIEKGEKIKGVIFDKTGTLTYGKPSVEKFLFFSKNEDVSENKALSMALSAELFSEHPLSKAIVTFIKEKKIEAPFPQKFENIPGKGVKAVLDGEEVFVGGVQLLKDLEISLDNDDNDLTKAYLVYQKKVLGAFYLRDTLKEEAASEIKTLQKLNLETIILSGDHEKAVSHVAKELSVSSFYAQVLPQDKARIVQEIQGKNGPMAMVGDGVNDAPALALAYLSFAMGGGTDVAREVSDIVLVGGNIQKISQFFQLSLKTMKVIRQNLFLSFIYNILCIPLAAGVFYYFGGPKLSPAMASLAMGLSSISVVLNSLRLKRGIS